MAIIEIEKDGFKVNPITLKTVRPFIYDSIVLDKEEIDNPNSVEDLQKFLYSKVNELLEDALKKLPQKEILCKYPSLKLPLLRLKVELAPGFATINPQRFGQKYVEKVANPADILLLSRKRMITKKDINSPMEIEAPKSNIKIDDFVNECLSNNPQQLQLLNMERLSDAIKQFVDKDEKDALSNFVEEDLKKNMERIME